MIWALVAGAVVLGAIGGWMLRAARDVGDSEKDWKTRLAARDRDLREAQQELADAVVLIQDLSAGQSEVHPAELAAIRRAVLELGLALEMAGPKTGAAALTRARATLSDLTGEQPTKRAAGILSGDDLTTIRGIGNGMARVLRTLGITTYRDLAEIDEEKVARLRDLLDGAPVRVDPDRWEREARHEHLRKYGAAL